MLNSAPTLPALADEAAAQYRHRYGRPPQWVVAAPGRVNLIGEHTDYNDGFVCPMAIERWVVIAAGRPSDGADETITLSTELLDTTHSFTLAEEMPTDLPAWCVYSYGVLDLLRKRGMEVGSLQASLLSTVPLGSGLSSSAALEVATATLGEAVTGQTLDGREKAKLCQQAENEYAGVPCGIMDQFASALCQEGEAMRLDCRSLETMPAPLADPDVAVLVTNSNVKHNLGESEYPVRRAQCESAAQKLGVPALRDTTLEAVESSSELSDIERRRARHVVTANGRVDQFCSAAAAGDWPAAGELMYQSHRSLRDDFEVSCEEVDKLVELAESIGASDGVFGSRITGGGFGGCTVTLVRRDQAGAIAAKLIEQYRAAWGKEAEAFITSAAQGAHQIG